MLDSNTTIFDINILKQEMIMMTLNEIISALEIGGYNATNQMIGYLLTGDLSYITNYKNARMKISKYTREEVMMALINGYLGR